MLANKLNYGDTIGVVGVSDSLKYNNEYDNFIRAESFLKSKGFKIKRGKYLLEDYYGSCGTKEQKCEDFMNMFLDSEVKAIICLEGGETCNTFIDLLDYDIIKENPKILVGYSDVTVLLQTIYKKTGLVTFSGPNFVSFGLPTAEEQYKIFEETFINKKLTYFESSNKKFIKKNNAVGKSIGTNLGCMMYLLGTDYLPDMQDKILFIESYRSSVSECQRRFSHLKQCGIFDKIKGIVIGYNYDLQKYGDIFPQMEDVLMDYIKGYDIAVIKCNAFGHKIVNSIIPIGVMCEINIEENKIKFIEEFLNE